MITIFTPTYNRAYILPELYKSLIRQTEKNFCWMVIDDGSTDDTESLMHTWQKECHGFTILYYKKENGGKHRAINFAMQYIDTEYTFFVDSDDKLTSSAIEKIERWILTIKGDAAFAGVAGLRGYDETHIIGSYPKNVKEGDYIDATNLQRRKCKLEGDKAEVYRTQLLKRYPFPEFEGEKFVTEAVVWNQIGSVGYKLRWFNDIIYIGDYLSDGMTKNMERLQKDNINGYFAGIKSEWEVHRLYRYRVLGRALLFIKRNQISIDELIIKIGSVKRYQILVGNCVMFAQVIWDNFKALRRNE